MWLNPCAIQVEKEANSELGWAVCASTTYERPCMCVLGISGGGGKDENQPYLNCRDLEQGRGGSPEENRGAPSSSRRMDTG